MHTLPIFDPYIRASNIVSKLERSLELLSTVVNANLQNNLDMQKPDDLAEIINQLLKYSINTSITEQNKIKSLLRRLIFLIQNNKSIFYPVTRNASPSWDKLQVITKQIGSVPQLMSKVTLPASQTDGAYWERWLSEKKQKWKELPCEEPSRSKNKKISFFKAQDMVLPRKALSESFTTEKIKYLDLPSGKLYLNLLDFEYYQIGLMHVDHFQPSFGLINRIKEMVDAMNDDKNFRKSMEDSIFNDGYFIDVKGKIVGSYWLYMAYHNSMQNLWFLLASDNSGSGKGPSDPIDWLKTFELGQNFLDYLANKDQSIIKNDILYTISDGTHLKESFIQWALKTKSQHLKTFQSIKELTEIYSRKARTFEKRGQLQFMRFETRLLKKKAERKNNTKNDSVSVGSFSSGNSSQIYQMAEQSLEKNEDYQAREKLQEEAKKSALQQAINQHHIAKLKSQ